MSAKPVEILVAGGASGGHTTAAQAIIGLVIRRAGLAPDSIVWVGRPGSIEERAAGELGVRFVAIAARPIQRHSLLSDIRSVLRSVIDARGLFRELGDVHLVIGTGGYVSVPALVAAATRRARVVIHEQTLIPGVANSLMALFAHRILLTFGEARRHLPVPVRRKAELVGMPLRPAFFPPMTPEEGRTTLGLSDDPIMYITGGALGADYLNQAVVSSLPSLLEDWQVIHQFGPDRGRGRAVSEIDLRHLRDALPQRLQHRYLVQPYFEARSAATILQSCDLIVSRAGAAIVSEILTLGLRAFLVPYPHARRDEQRALAALAAEKGGVTVVDQAHTTPEEFARLLCATEAFVRVPTRSQDDPSALEEHFLRTLAQAASPGSRLVLNVQ